MLTIKQTTAAVKLLESRPTVIPGTCVIVDDGARQAYYDLVVETMRDLAIPEADFNQFCDLCGVPK